MRVVCRLTNVLVMIFTASLALAVMDDDPGVLIQQGHYKQAQAILEKHLAANSQDAGAMVQLAQVKLAFRDNESATKLATKAVALSPKDAQAHAIMADCYGQRAEGDVGMFEQFRLARSFKSEAETALSLDPKNYEALHSF